MVLNLIGEKKKEVAVGYKREAERKFLVRSFPIEVLQGLECYWIEQAYPKFKHGIRVRNKLPSPFVHTPTSVDSVPDGPTLVQDEWQGTITMKKRMMKDDWRTQFELESAIDPEFVREFSEGAPSLHKARFVIGRFELDIFTNDELRGLVMMEIELHDTDEKVELPEGFDVVEVTEDNRFRSASLAQIKKRKEVVEILEEYGIKLEKGGERG